MVCWDALYNSAMKAAGMRKVSDTIEAGTVAAALLTEKGNIYVGISIDTACSLGMCAERNAIANMLTNGEDTVAAILAVRQNGQLIAPCGSCCELLRQLGGDTKGTEILVDLKEKRAVKLIELLPVRWN